jgi:maltooligosyltrehalose trehalohydrolase
MNIGDSDQTVPFWFPLGGDYVEKLHGGTLDLKGVPQLGQVYLTVPRYYGRVWTAAGA